MPQVELPTEVELEVPGGDSVWFNYPDVTSDQAWLKLNRGDPHLRPMDFKDDKAFQKYFYLSSGLLTGIVFVYGAEGEGKSLFCNHLAYHGRVLFNKKCTLNWRPKKGFGAYDYIDNDILIEELNKLRDLTQMQNDINDDDEDANEEVKKKLEQSRLYNRIYILDESYEDVDKARRTNTTRNYGRLIRQHRHLHSLVCFVSPDREDFDRRMLWNRRTHEVSCSKDRIVLGYCSMIIWWKKKNITKQMHIKPENWSYLWDSWNLAMGGTVLKVKN